MKQQVQVVVVLVAACGVCLTAAMPQGTINNEVLGPEVGASFGGFQASAGLSGGPHAQASVPGGPAASATSSSSSSTSNNQPNRKPGQFYDNIFNIPISVLQAVNQLLQGGGRAKASAGAGAVSQNPTPGIVAGSSASSSASAGAAAGVQANTRQSNFFDDIFNIPISALTSVNQLLNSKEKLQIESRSFSNATDTSYPSAGDRRQFRREERARRRQLHNQKRYAEPIDGAGPVE